MSTEAFRKYHRDRQQKTRIREKLEGKALLEKVRKDAGLDTINEGKNYADYFSGSERDRILRRTEWSM